MDQGAEQTIGEMLREYNGLVGQVMVINPTLNYRERKCFKDRKDATKSLEALQSTLRALKAAPAAVEPPPSPQQSTAEQPIENKEPEMAAKKKNGTKKTPATNGARRGRKPAIGDEMLIFKKRDENPKREGTKGREYWKKYRDGMTVGSYRNALGDDFANWFHWDLKHDLIEVRKP